MSKKQKSLKKMADGVMKGIGFKMGIDDLLDMQESLPLEHEYLKQQVKIMTIQIFYLKQQLNFKFNDTQLEVLEKEMKVLDRIKQKIKESESDDES